MTGIDWLATFAVVIAMWAWGKRIRSEWSRSVREAHDLGPEDHLGIISAARHDETIAALTPRVRHRPSSWNYEIIS